MSHPRQPVAPNLEFLLGIGLEDPHLVGCPNISRVGPYPGRKPLFQQIHHKAVPDALRAKQKEVLDLDFLFLARITKRVISPVDPPIDFIVTVIVIVGRCGEVAGQGKSTRELSCSVSACNHLSINEL